MVALFESEKIILERRRHWYVIVAEAAGLLLIAIFLPMVVFVLKNLIPAIDEFMIIFFIAVLWQLSWIIFFVMWTNYYLDVLLVTNKRIIDIEQIGLFARDTVEIRLENIQDIKTEVVGLLPSLLKMGNLHIQTAGQAKEVVIKNIPDPYNVQEIISKSRDEILSKQNTA
ncbi:MAG: hypothetical protein DDT19_02438 [Syntrophomonadaceae bacterium]|nr:hypothetical protein [Bacillota bacterium]